MTRTARRSAARGAATLPSNGRQPPRRRTILAAASRMFLELGYGASTIDELIRRIGGSKRTVYGYFPGKEALFIAVIDEVVGEIVRPLPDIDALSLDVRETLMVVAQQHIETVLSERHVALVRLVAAEARRFPNIGRDYYEHGPARGHAKIEHYLSQQHRQGTLNVPDPRRAADHFWGMLLHHETLRRLYNVVPPPKAASIKAACAAAVEAFMDQHARAPARLSRRARRPRTAPP